MMMIIELPRHCPSILRWCRELRSIPSKNNKIIKSKLKAFHAHLLHDAFSIPRRCVVESFWRQCSLASPRVLDVGQVPLRMAIDTQQQVHHELCNVIQVPTIPNRKHKRQFSRMSHG